MRRLTSAGARPVMHPGPPRSEPEARPGVSRGDGRHRTWPATTGAARTSTLVNRYPLPLPTWF